MQNATRDLMGTQRQAATKLREALSEMQTQEVARDMERNAGWIRRGQGEYAAMSESQTTAGLESASRPAARGRTGARQGQPGWGRPG
jgi:hypothetical protein